MFKRLILSIAASALSLSAQATDAETRLTRWLNGIAQEQLDRRDSEIRNIHTGEQARARQEQVRKKIMELLCGLPDYTGPLNARVTGRIEKPGYIIEKVVFESLPRFYVTGNLY